MGHGIDTTQYSRGYTLNEVVGSNGMQDKATLLNRMKSLDKRCVLIALAIFTVLTISGLGFFAGVVLGGITVTTSILAGGAALMYLRACQQKKQDLSEIIPLVDVAQGVLDENPSLFPNIFEIESQTTDIEPDAYNHRTLELVKDEIDRDLRRKSIVYYNGERIESAEHLAKLCNNDQLILEYAHQGFSDKATIALLEHLMTYNETYEKSFSPQQFSVCDSDDKVYLMKTYIYDSKAARTATAVNYFNVQDTSNDGELVDGLSYEMTTLVDLNKMTTTVQGSKFLGSSGISAVPTK